MTKQYDYLRMELQITELIRIVANLNDRLKKLEQIEQDRQYLHFHGTCKETVISLSE